MRLTPILIICLLIVPACHQGHGVDYSKATFGIYLTKYNVRPYNLKDYTYVEPAEDPLLSLDDIVSYNWSSHVLHLTERGRQAIDTMFVPVQGKSFCVCVNNSPKYYGGFWITISSIPFTGTTIIQRKPLPDSIRIGRGYPVDYDSTMPDPRNNAEVEAVLRATGRFR